MPPGETGIDWNRYHLVVYDGGGGGGGDMILRGNKWHKENK
jgi:hypothetical protein